MVQAQIILDKDFAIGQVDPRLFGGFIEHLGRHIYTGIYEPGHPTADEQGFRRDVLELVRRLCMPVMRYPGGNFVSGYNWEDGVGPRKDRPRRLDLAWRSTETNAFGLHEFVDWCAKAQTQPMLAVNLGTRGPDEARRLVEYCNHPGGTALSDLRRAHGHEKPHGVKLWCLGNEMDGPWQIGHKTATEYGRIAAQAAKVMRGVDPSIELVVCGSSGHRISTFGHWELEVLSHTCNLVDYISLHAYFDNFAKDTPNFLAMPDSMGEHIDKVVALCDAASARARSKKKLMLSFDEWNVWYHDRGSEERIEPWAVAPRLNEEIYTMEDALVVGGMLIALLNHADRVKIACVAQVVNVGAAVMTAPGGPAWVQPVYYPFLHASTLGRGTVLRQVVQSDRYDAKDRPGTPYLSTACVLRPDGQGLTILAINRSLTEELALAVDLRGLGAKAVARWTVLRHDDLQAVNTRENPGRVAPVAQAGAVVRDGRVMASLPAASWNVLEISC